MLEVKIEPTKQDVYDSDYRLDLVMIYNGVEILRECDVGEPEDQTLSRDWSWVKPAIEKAYQLGIHDCLEDISPLDFTGL